MARANDVLDYYLNGPGSFFAAGPREPPTAPPKPLTGELGDSTVADLKKFKESVIASKQFADDPGAIMGAVADLIDETIKQVQTAARYSEGRNTIARPPPSIDNPIDDPRVTSPRQLNNAPLRISLTAKQAQPAASLQAGAMPAMTDDDAVSAQGDPRNFHAATPPVRLGTSTPTDPRDIRVLSSPVLPLGARRTQPGIPNQTQQTGRPVGIFTGQPMPNILCRRRSLVCRLDLPHPATTWMIGSSCSSADNLGPPLQPSAPMPGVSSRNPLPHSHQI